MGGVKDICIKSIETGDRVCGRTVSGLDVNSHKFSVSPPWNDSSKEEEDDINDAKQTSVWPHQDQIWIAETLFSSVTSVPS